MKKILLSCCLALGIGASAQTTILSDNFETATNGSYGGWTSGFFGSATSVPAARNDFMVRSSTDCPTGSVDGSGQHLQIVRYATNAFSNCTYAGQTTAYQPLVYKTIDAREYKNIILSFDWVGVGQTGQDYGILRIAPNNGNTFYAVQNLLGSATKQHVEINLSEYFDGVEQIDFTQLNLGFSFLANNTTHNGPGLSVDNIVVTGEKPTVAPSCTTFAGVSNGSVVNAGTYSLNWNSDANASAYKLTVGTTSGGSDTYSGTLAGLTASVPLAVNTTYYAKVVPTNSVGDATGCTEITFSTNSVVAYCIPSAGSVDELITRVAIAGTTLNNPSTATGGYEDFSASTAATATATLNQGQAYNATITNAPAYTGDQTVIWVDYNQDGAFTDAEKVILTGTTSATGSISVPSNAKLGTTRMRVRLHYNSPAITLSPCGSTAYGQSEDYTVTIGPSLAVSDVNKAGVSVYPNPFTDVLKISDIKDVKSVSVSDVSGRQVKSLAPSAELNLSSLKAGLYIINLNMEDGSVKTFKAIKK